MIDGKNDQSVVIKILKRTGLILGGLFVIFSLVPYLVSTHDLDEDRHELAYANSDFCEIDGVELHYRRWEGLNGRGENVLLVHGLGASTFSWRYTAPILQEEGFRVVAVDLPGFGLSERKTGLDHSAWARAELLWTFLEQVFPGEKWNLVGHSMGGATVTAMALQKPEETESLVLVAGALVPFEPSLLSAVLGYPPAARWTRVIGSRWLADESRVEELLASAYGEQPTEHELSGYYLPLNVKGTDAVWPDLLKTAPDPLIDHLGDLRMPVLCIWGEEDSWVPVEQAFLIHSLIAYSELIVMPGEGHVPMETAPDRFDKKLADFICKVCDDS